MKCFLDTETCGFHGPIILLQYAFDDDDITLHEVFNSPIEDTLNVLEEILSNEIIGFNLSFDWFHICQTYTTLIQFKDKSICPIDAIDEYADYEEKGRFGPCLKPKTAFDILLYARRGPYQCSMQRSDIRIKKVPTQLSDLLCRELNKRLTLDEIMFAK